MRGKEDTGGDEEGKVITIRKVKVTRMGVRALKVY